MLNWVRTWIELFKIDVEWGKDMKIDFEIRYFCARSALLLKISFGNSEVFARTERFFENLVIVNLAFPGEPKPRRVIHFKTNPSTCSCDYYILTHSKVFRESHCWSFLLLPESADSPPQQRDQNS